MISCFVNTARAKAAGSRPIRQGWEPLTYESAKLESLWVCGEQPLAFVDPVGLDWLYACVGAGGTMTCEWYWTGSVTGAVLKAVTGVGQPEVARWYSRKQWSQADRMCLAKGAVVGAASALAVGALAVGAVAVGAPVAAVTGVLGVLAVREVLLSVTTL